jgi:hypothetical protein
MTAIISGPLKKLAELNQFNRAILTERAPKNSYHCWNHKTLPIHPEINSIFKYMEAIKACSLCGKTPLKLLKCG